MAASKEGSPSAALAELSGTVLEQRYELGRVLGAGGMGAVFEARHLRLDRPVAIKVLRPMYAVEGEYVERFLREAKAASKIQHRNVVEILDYGEAAGGLVYSVMQFLVGQDLQQLLDSRPEHRIPWSEACGLLVQIASGLKAAHGQQVIHRDIKPANCFLTEEDGDPVVKLVDFGIARLEGGERGATLTGTAQVLGTPAYIAPELVRTEHPASARSDIYALGVVAYRMLTGRVPFSGRTVFEILRHACFDPVPSMRAQVPELPAPVERFVEELLAKEPEQRPPDMLTVRRRLIVLSQETIGAQAVEIPGSSGIPLSLEQGLVSPAMTEKQPAMPVTPKCSTALREKSAQKAELTEAPEGVGVVTEQPAVREVGITAVMMEPMLADLRPPAASRELTPPSVVKTPEGNTSVLAVQPVLAPAATSSRPAETMPSVGESTLRNLEQSRATDRPRSRMGPWIGIGVLAVLMMVGASVAFSMIGGDDGASELAAEAGETPRVDAVDAVDAADAAESVETVELVESIELVKGASMGSDAESSGASHAVELSMTGDSSATGTYEWVGGDVEVSSSDGGTTDRSPEEPLLPEASTDSAGDDDEFPKLPFVSKKKEGPDEAECARIRTEAMAAKIGRDWNDVLKSTKIRACWPGSAKRLERRRLRVKAHAETGDFRRCVKEGGKSTDKEIAPRVIWCKKKLEGL